MTRRRLCYARAATNADYNASSALAPAEVNDDDGMASSCATRLALLGPIRAEGLVHEGQQRLSSAARIAAGELMDLGAGGRGVRHDIARATARDEVTRSDGTAADHELASVTSVAAHHLASSLSSTSSLSSSTSSSSSSSSTYSSCFEGQRHIVDNTRHQSARATSNYARLRTNTAVNKLSALTRVLNMRTPALVGDPADRASVHSAYGSLASSDGTNALPQTCQAFLTTCATRMQYFTMDKDVEDAFRESDDDSRESIQLQARAPLPDPGERNDCCDHCVRAMVCDAATDRVGSMPPLHKFHTSADIDSGRKIDCAAPVSCMKLSSPSHCVTGPDAHPSALALRAAALAFTSAVELDDSYVFDGSTACAMALEDFNMRVCDGGGGGGCSPAETQAARVIAAATASVASFAVWSIAMPPRQQKQRGHSSGVGRNKRAKLCGQHPPAATSATTRVMQCIVRAARVASPPLWLTSALQSSVRRKHWPLLSCFLQQQLEQRVALRRPGGIGHSRLTDPPAGLERLKLAYQALVGVNVKVEQPASTTDTTITVTGTTLPGPSTSAAIRLHASDALHCTDPQATDAVVAVDASAANAAAIVACTLQTGEAGDVATSEISSVIASAQSPLLSTSTSCFLKQLDDNNGDTNNGNFLAVDSGGYLPEMVGGGGHPLIPSSATAAVLRFHIGRHCISHALLATRLGMTEAHLRVRICCCSVIQRHLPLSTA